jgi:Predicted transcriptional regulator
MDDIVTVNLGTLRRAIRQEQKVDVEYTDSTGAITARTIWPLALIYYVDAVTIAAWCELRAGLRHFRLDRVQGWSLNDNHFTGQDAALLAQREETQKPGAVTTRTL